MDGNSTRDKVRILLQEGKRPADIAQLLGISRSSVSYHKKRLGYPMNYECTTRYDWGEVQRYYDSGHGITACITKFGFSRWAWAYAVRRGDLVPRQYPMPIEQLLGRVPRSRTHLKNRLLKAGLLDPHCEECGISEWRTRPLPLELHHRNGDGVDNRLENLSLLCPNCHSQTPTWGGKNRGQPARAR